MAVYIVLFVSTNYDETLTIKQSFYVTDKKKYFLLLDNTHFNYFPSDNTTYVFLVDGEYTLCRSSGDGRGLDGQRRGRNGSSTTRRETATKGPNTCHRTAWQLMGDSVGDADERGRSRTSRLSAESSVGEMECRKQ